MSKREKLADRICADRTPADITWPELVTFLRGLGYEVLHGAGSRRKFFNSAKDLMINLHEPHPKNIVAKVYIKDVVDHLRENSII